MRDAVEADVTAIADLAVAAGLFESEERDLVVELLHQHLSQGAASMDVCLVEELKGAVTGVAYARPKEATDRGWDLTMFAVHPDWQGAGIGPRLLNAIEQALNARRARMVLVETSSLPAYTRARALYARSGYAEVARVADYWQDGDDLVMFGKRLG